MAIPHAGFRHTPQKAEAMQAPVSETSNTTPNATLTG